MSTEREARLGDILAAIGDATVAVSGGVDSMTLAHLAHHRTRAQMVHAVSPAVPPDATARVRAHADAQGWRLAIIDAGEFADDRYRANPANRCYFCKLNLYGVIAGRFPGTILSGTNTDDLGDFRPGLAAAAENGVRHPFVEAGIDKAGVRAMARGLGLDDLAELPAAPCLSSRIETGIAIDPAHLVLVDRIERLLRADLGPVDVRCRVVASGVRIELSDAALADFADRRALRVDIEHAVAAAGHAFLGYGPYRRGSAFLRGPAHA